MSRYQRAFTLTEVLVCIAVLALLAGLFFTVQGKAKSNAHLASDTEKLRQIGLASLIYREDQGGDAPRLAVLATTQNLPPNLLRTASDPIPGGSLTTWIDKSYSGSGPAGQRNPPALPGPASFLLWREVGGWQPNLPDYMGTEPVVPALIAFISGEPFPDSHGPQTFFVMRGTSHRFTEEGAVARKTYGEGPCVLPQTIWIDASESAQKAACEAAAGWPL